ncbi:MAG TPA: hypothetical protein VGI39_31420, partial [Polyangiaceae bacterium]
MRLRGPLPLFPLLLGPLVASSSLACERAPHPSPPADASPAKGSAALPPLLWRAAAIAHGGQGSPPNKAD